MEVNERESIYYLRSPKTLKLIQSDFVILDKSTSKLSSQIPDLPSFDININNLSKLDKKYKNNINTPNDQLLDIKKNKLKSIKKNRKNVSVSKDDLLNDDTLIIEQVKAHKLSKSKKKGKDKFSKYQVDSIVISHPMDIKDLANRLSIPEAEIITYLFLKGIAVTVNQLLDMSIAKDIATHYNVAISENDNSNFIKSAEQKKINYSKLNTENSVTRSPVITIFGHVDHGKTTLLDSILKTNLVMQEHGGITQSIMGYELNYSNASKLVKLLFIDTPGHEAFTDMRLRGAKIADIVLLIIAADDGLKPQTIESIKVILEMNLSYIVVINKIDKKHANVALIKEELTKYGILSEELGGNAIIHEVSALTGQNIDSLISKIFEISQAKDLLANPDKLAEGTILEAYINDQQGITTDLLVQNGTLKVGDFILAGNTFGRVKRIMNNSILNIKQVGPSSIIKVLGFSKLPESGVLFKAYRNDKNIKKYILDKSNKNSTNFTRLFNNQISLGDINNITLKTLNIIIKTDTRGSLEAIINSLHQIIQKKVKLNLLVASVGNISISDIDLALSSQAIIIGFNIKIGSNIISLSKNKNIIVSRFDIIYDVLDHIKTEMLNLVEPEYEDLIIGQAIVQTVFNINKGVVAGCLVKTGKLQKKCHINIYRNNSIIHKGILDSLKHIKDDVDEVIEGNECGVLCNSFELWQNLDKIEAYQLEEKEKVL